MDKEFYKNAERLIAKFVSVSYAYVQNRLYDIDDLRQELWLKAVEIDRKYKDKPLEEKCKILGTALNNRISQIINYSKSRPDTSNIASKSLNDVITNDDGDDDTELVEIACVTDDSHVYEQIDMQSEIEMIRKAVSHNERYLRIIDDYLKDDEGKSFFQYVRDRYSGRRVSGSRAIKIIKAIRKHVDNYMSSKLSVRS